MKSSISTAAVIALALSAACSTSHASTPGFTITTPVPAESKNKMAYLINRETGDKVDSMLITGNELKFSGTVADPYYARILIGDKRGPSFIVEPGEITIAQDGKMHLHCPQQRDERLYRTLHSRGSLARFAPFRLSETGCRRPVQRHSRQHYESPSLRPPRAHNIHRQSLGVPLHIRPRGIA